MIHGDFAVRTTAPYELGRFRSIFYTGHHGSGAILLLLKKKRKKGHFFSVIAYLR